MLTSHYYLQIGVAQNTAKTYRAAQKRYLEFCERFSLQPLPATEQVLILFVAELAQSVSHACNDLDISIRCTKPSFDKRVVRSTNEDTETGSSSKWHPEGKGTSFKGEIASDPTNSEEDPWGV